jgi:NDP-sugar pyrophosphorylase family protein
MRAIILAGGKGTRLRPYTTVIPKPLVPIGNQMPILEIIIRQLAQCGFRHITITVNHLAELIMAFFNNGAKWGVNIDYSIEDRPLSTIAPLTLINPLPENFLVMNGDVLCDMDYRAFYNHHIKENNKVTVAVFRRNVKIDFGVIKYDDRNAINAFVEKPVYEFDVSMGIYCINRSVIEKVPVGKPYGFDNLMLDGIKNNEKYSVKQFDGLWLDIGRPEDYDYCNEYFETIKDKLGCV